MTRRLLNSVQTATLCSRSMWPADTRSPLSPDLSPLQRERRDPDGKNSLDTCFPAAVRVSVLPGEGEKVREIGPCDDVAKGAECSTSVATTRRCETVLFIYFFPLLNRQRIQQRLHSYF